MSKTRGKTKAGQNWRRGPEDGLAVICLELDVSAGTLRQRLQRHFRAAFELRRALQCDARSRCRTYWGSRRERRKASPAQVRERLSLSQTGFEKLAKEHVEGSEKLQAHLTKALALHMADSVWAPVKRNLFNDSSGHRGGIPGVGRYYEFTRIPGRARSHTAERKWETYRLHGTLQGHLDAYRAPGLAARSVPDVIALHAQAGELHAQAREVDGDAHDEGVRVLDQGKRMRAPELTTRSWHDHQGALCMVINLPGGELVAPVRLPSGAGRWERLAHFLASPDCWHKLDLVRVQDHRAHGGWRYEAHLTVLKDGYVSEAEAQRRAEVPRDRRAGVDVNVSNVTVSSTLEDGGDYRTDRIDFTKQELAAAKRRAREHAREQRKLDRSRRGCNPEQYEPSKAQVKHNERRVKAGLEPVVFSAPMGPRVANQAGVPKSAYRRDELSKAYRRTRAVLAQSSRSLSQAKHARAREFAKRMVAAHGARFSIEDNLIANWKRLWGRRIGLFSPGMLCVALDAYASACGGYCRKASTYHTRLSQICSCGRDVIKTLKDRVHDCAGCGIVADRDEMSAALGSCVTHADPTDPRSARVDAELRALLHAELLKLYDCSKGPARGSRTVKSTRSEATRSSAQGPTQAPPSRGDRHPGTGPEGSPASTRRRQNTVSNPQPAGLSPPADGLRLNS